MHGHGVATNSEQARERFEGARAVGITDATQGLHRASEEPRGVVLGGSRPPGEREGCNGLGLSIFATYDGSLYFVFIDGSLFFTMVVRLVFFFPSLFLSLCHFLAHVGDEAKNDSKHNHRNSRIGG